MYCPESVMWAVNAYHGQSVHACRSQRAGRMEAIALSGRKLILAPKGLRTSAPLRWLLSECVLAGEILDRVDLRRHRGAARGPIDSRGDETAGSHRSSA